MFQDYGLESFELPHNTNDLTTTNLTEAKIKKKVIFEAPQF